MEFPNNKRYNIILIDPAWTYKDKALAGNRGAGCKYNLMTTEDIKKLPIDSIAADDCVLFCLVTFPKMNEVFDVIKAWGFEYKTCAFTWVKKTKNDKQSRLDRGFLNTINNWLIGFRFLFLGNKFLLSLGNVSGKNQITKIRLNTANPLATHTGNVTLNLARAVPNPGPRIKPKPNATPINPKVFARFSGVDISASIVVAVAAVPPLIPSIILAEV